ncbi:hypothetical protein [Methanocaldococcus sp.]
MMGKRAEEVVRYLRGVKDIKIPLIYKVLFAPIFGIFLCLIGFFLYYTPYAWINLIIYMILVILLGVVAAIIIMIRAYAPRFVLELMKIKLFRRPNQCILIYVDELGIMETSIGEIDFSVREVKDLDTGLRYDFSEGDVVYYYKVPVIFVNAATARAIPVKHVDTIRQLKKLGFKTLKDVKKFLENTEKKIGENLQKINELKIEYDVTKNDEVKKEITKLEKETRHLKQLIKDVEEALTTLPFKTINLKEVIRELGNENHEIKLAKAQRYYLAGYTRGLRDEGFLQVLKWITLIAALIAMPVVAYIVVKAFGG